MATRNSPFLASSDVLLRPMPRIAQAVATSVMPSWRTASGVQIGVLAQVEAEADEVIGAVRYERTDTRINERNGARPRTLSTKAGDIDCGWRSCARWRS